MRKVYIQLNHNTGEKIPNGCIALVAIAHGAPGQNQVTISESTIFNTKQQAWDTIRNRAKNLDYEVDEIFFNNQKVDSFVTVEQMVKVF